MFSASSRVARAYALCKDIVVPSQNIEAILIQDRSEVTAKVVKDALAASAPIYKAMVELYNEMVSIGRSQGANKLKKLTV